jgi:2-polyprenyl-6-hydroxyphenyl methylase/3-demethylubiquinone-9 3-methyltransferase
MPATPPNATTVDAEDVARFSAIAAEWWDETGKFKPLHRMNPLRIGFVRDRACAHFGHDPLAAKPLSGLTLLDVGCGGGLLSEPMARLGARVTGIDASERNIEVAKLHAAQAGVEVEYRVGTAEEVVVSSEFRVPSSEKSPATRNSQPATAFDLVLALEIVEHVADVPLFMRSLAALLKPGGLLIMSTLNRTFKSYAMAIIGAERVLRWLPRGTHDWKQFLTPPELAAHLRANDLRLIEQQGMVFNPLNGSWSLSERDLEVNYLVVATK